MMKIYYLIGLLTTSICSFTFSQEHVSGIVYEDMNKNGQRDKRDKPLPNVGVSNGIDVVLTNEKGEYKLEVGEDNIIFVIKPEGYTSSLDSNFLHKFYHIHKPHGAPTNLKYAGASATGKLPKSVDFALYRQEESDKFQAFIFGDPQTYTKEEIDFFNKGLIDVVQGKEKVSFGLSLGDLVGDDLVLHPLYQQSVAKLQLPWYNVIGNHDMNLDVTADSLSDETFERNFGPANYAFNYGNAHFIVLDDILYPYPKTGKGYWGGFREDQLRFLENNLKLVPKDKLIVIAYHIPLFLTNRDEKHFRPEDRQRFMDLIAPFPNTVSLSAHTHYQEQVFFTQEDGWKRATPHHEYNVGTTSGDWYSGALNELGVPVSTMRDGTPKGYAVMTVDGNKYSFDYQVAGKEKDYQIQLFGAETVKQKYSRRYKLHANFFMGKKGDKVQVRVDNGEWKEMQYVENPDPKYTLELLQYDNVSSTVRDGRRPSDPVNSTHLWRFAYPNLKSGTHLFEVKATDMYGKEHFAKKTVSVVE